MPAWVELMSGFTGAAFGAQKIRNNGSDFSISRVNL